MLNLNKDIKNLENILVKDYNHEIPDIPRSKAFARRMSCVLKRMFPTTEGYTVHSSDGVYCEPTGFIEKGGKYVYYSFQDYRYWDWKEKILYRVAESLKDYHGGPNHTCSFKELEKNIKSMLKGE